MAAVLCLSLAACGDSKAQDNSGTAQGPTINNSAQDTGEPSNTELTVQTVEITLDNWQEYFEIREYLSSITATNDFGEPTKYMYGVYTLFAMKEELAENVVSCDVAIEYDADSSPKNISFNAKDVTFEITGDCENKDIPSDYRDSSRFTRGATAKLNRERISQHYLKDGKVEGETVVVPYSAVISGFENIPSKASILIDNDSEWQETNEGFTCKYTENVRITRIQGKLVLNQ